MFRSYRQRPSLSRIGRKFDGETQTLLGYTSDQLHNPAEFKRFIKAKVEAELAGKVRLGSNPEVFSYQFTDPDQFGCVLAHLQFYGGLDIYVALIPKGDPLPKNMAMELIQMGIPTFVSFNGKLYEFRGTDDQVCNSSRVPDKMGHSSAQKREFHLVFFARILKPMQMAPLSLPLCLRVSSAAGGKTLLEASMREECGERVGNMGAKGARHNYEFSDTILRMEGAGGAL